MRELFAGEGTVADDEALRRRSNQLRQEQTCAEVEVARQRIQVPTSSHMAAVGRPLIRPQNYLKCCFLNIVLWSLSVHPNIHPNSWQAS
jgi:hypothetical protein